VNIGHLLDCASRNAGGLFESARRLAQSFPQVAGTTVVFSTWDEQTAHDAKQWQPLELRTFPRKVLPAWGYAPSLPGALCDANLEILLTHGLWKYCSVASLSWHRRTHRPYVIHCHGMLDPWAVQNSKWKKRCAALLYENAHLRNAACLRALCESEAKAIRAYGLRNPICIIPNGTDLPDLMVHRPAPWATEVKDRKVLLYLGRLHPKKNLAPLLEAWAALQRDTKSARDWILGIAGWDQNGYESELRQLASDLGIRSSIIFLGPRFDDERAAAYQNSSAFILPSLSEGLPMAILEAWAFGKPVLMTNECNLPEGFAGGAALRIGTTADDIAPGLRRLFDMSEGDLSAMGERGRALVAERFQWPHLGDEMRRVCEWLVNGGNVPASVSLD
jgi:poly(glycerol-phosphate) alpha-glucosyltransferase